MHEYSLVLALFDRVKEEADRKAARSVRTVVVSVGELSGVEPDLLAQAFIIAKLGTCCADAELKLERVAAKWLCSSCQAPLTQADELVCERCQAPGRLVQGGEILLMRVVLEV